MKCPNCGHENPDGAEDCPSCGIFFAKWNKRAQPAPEGETAAAAQAEQPKPGSRLAAYLFAGLLLASGLGWLAYKALQPGEPKTGAGQVPASPYSGGITAPEAALSKDEPANAQLSMQRAVASTDALIAEARLETQQFGEEAVDLLTLKARPENGPRLESWRAWVLSWQQRVASVSSSLPDPKTMAGFELQESHRAVSQVLTLLAEPPGPGPGVPLAANDPLLKAHYLPERNSRESWLDNADSWMKYPRSIVNKAAGAEAGPK